MCFAGEVAGVYNPLDYAWRAHRKFLDTYGRGQKRVVFMGMNPGPWGMAQTGVPFGEVAMVRDWMGIEAKVEQPKEEHPKRPIQGFACERSEVSGRRLWGLMAERFGTADVFFTEHFITNFCPLVFMADTGRNITPDKLPVHEREPLEVACVAHLRGVLHTLQPEVVVGVGAYAETRLRQVVGDDGPPVMRMLHPSPASPAANRDWAGTATKQLVAAGVWGAA